jgi:hypothetical protein
MSVLVRPAVLLATASVAAGLLVAPGAAYAAVTTTTLTAAQLAAELTTVGTASAKAGAQGWKGSSKYTFTFPGSTTVFHGTGTTQADLVHGRYADRFSAAGLGSADMFAIDGRGRWDPAQDPDELRALKMMGRTTVKYAFTADTTLDLADYIDENAPSPVAMTTGIDGGGTKVTHDDGTVELTATDEEGAKVRLQVGPSGLLTGAHVALDRDGGGAELDVTFGYGPQTVALPAGAETIPAAALATGVAYLGMAENVKVLAGAVATRVRGGKVSEANVRAAARTTTTAWNGSSPVRVTTKSVAGGARVSATNPWTKKTVAYTVKASGRKVLVKKG